MSFLLTLLVLGSAWECGVTPDFEINVQPTSPLPRRFSERHLSIDYNRTSTAFSPIRIHVEYMELTLSDTMTTELKQTVMPAAISWLQHSLSVNPIIGKLTLDVTTCIDVSVPASHRTVGVDADYILYVYGTGEASGYVARAGACAYEQGTRSYPVAGMLQINSQNYNEYLTLDIRFEVILHELTHALGFMPKIWSLFTNQDGTPYASYNVTVTERGASRVKLTFPTVLEKVRAYFGCPDLDGAELEDAGGGGTVSSHWEKRIFGTEYMVGSIATDDFSFTEITLALFADSGFYKVSYDYATPLLWGKGEGCGFHSKRCVESGVAQFPEFCTSTQETCDVNNVNLAYCDITTGLTLAAANQYFSDPTRGGSDSLRDNCPARVSYSNAKCRQSILTRSGRTQKAGANSRCFAGTWGLKSVLTTPSGSCQEVTCSATKATVHLDNSTSVDCPAAGGNVTLSDPYAGTLTCPSYDQLCTSSPCAAGCLARGKCVMGVCQCGAGYSGLRCENACSTHCGTCDAADASKCLTCPQHAELSSGDCVCASQTSWAVSGVCASTACSKSCASCSGAKCASCWDNAALSSDGTCTCSDRFFPNSDGSACLACDTSCRQCSGPDSDQCTACFPGAAVYITGECACTAGYYTDTYADNCQACDPSCKTCSGSGNTKCTSCFTGATVAGFPGKCGCLSNFYAPTTSQTCVACDSSCVACSAAACISCPINAYVSGTRCVCSANYNPSPDVSSCMGTCHYTCASCVSSSSAPDQCLTCYTNAQSSGTFPSTCVCKDGYFPSPNTSNCKLCYAQCATCINSSVFGCTSCAGSASQRVLLDIGLICVDSCPYRYNNDGKSCRANSGKAIDFLFGSYTNFPIDSVNGLLAFCGSSTYFYPAPDNGDPLPAPNAGLHFNGVFNSVELPPHLNDTTTIILATTHYVELWVRPDSATGKRQCLLTKTYVADKILNFCISPSAALTLEMKFNSFNDTNSKLLQAFSAGTVTSGRVWQLLAYQLSYSNYNTVVKLIRNDLTVGSFVAYGNIFLDTKGSLGSMMFWLGGRYNGYSLADAFGGNIAQLVIYQGVEVTPVIKAACGCSQCSSANTCLSNCLLTEADVQGQCQPCLASCTLGCYRTTDCLLNADPLCSVSANATSCTTCVPYAAISGGKCACVANASPGASGTSCSCNSPYQPNSGIECVACKKYFQATEVSAAYDASFVKFYVIFADKVNLAGFLSCASFIASESLARLGTGPACAWSADSTVMTVVLGTGAKLGEEPLKLLQGYIFTKLDTTVCGYLPVVLAPVVKLPTKKVPPVAIITVPRLFSLGCGDDGLLVSGEASTGAFSRGFNYTWEVVSDAASSLPISIVGQSSFSLPRLSLVAGVLRITLRLQNFFGLNDTATVEVRVTDAPVLDVRVSGGPLQTVARSSRLLLRANFASRCNLTGTASYQWSLSSTNNSDPGPAKLAISPQGNLCYLSADGLLSEFYYVYNVTVTVGSAVGFSPVNLTVVRPPLVTVVTPSSGEFPSALDLQLSAQSTDPGNLAGDFSYNWTCSEGTSGCKASDGSVLLASSSTPDTAIKAGRLKLGAVYTFTVTVSKDWRTSSETRQMTVVAGNGCSVQLPVAALRVSAESALQVTPTLTVLPNASFAWSQFSGPPVSFQSSISVLSIAANSFAAGASYAFRLSITTNSTISAYFSVAGNWPPSSGTLSARPNSGIALVDFFAFEADAWEDPDGQDYPLSYKFFAASTAKVALTPLSLAQRLITKMGLGTSGVSVKVCDVLGGCSEASVSVTVSKYVRLLQTQQVQFQSDTRDPDLVPSMVAAYSASQLLDEATLREMLRTLDSYSAAQPADSSLLDIALSAILAMQAQAQLVRNMTSSWAQYELAVLTRLTDPISQAQAAQSLSLFSGITYKEEELGSVQWLVSTVLTQYLATLVQGQSAFRFKSPAFSVFAQRLLGSQLSNSTFSTDSASVSLPEEFTAEASIGDSALVDLIFAHFNRTDGDSDVAWLQLLSVGDYSQGVLTRTAPSNITVQSLSHAINFTFPAKLNLTITYDCWWQSVSAWRNSCSILNVTSTTATVSTIYMAPILIRVQLQTDPTPLPAPTDSAEVCEMYYVPIGLLIALSGLTCILLITAVVLDYLGRKKQAKSPKKPKVEERKESQAEEQYHSVDLDQLHAVAAADVNVQVADPAPGGPQSEPLAKRSFWHGVLEGHYVVGLYFSSPDYPRWPKAVTLYVVLVVELACNSWFVQGLDSPGDGEKISFVDTFDAFDGWNCLYAVISVGIALVFSIALMVIFTIRGRLGEDQQRKSRIFLLAAAVTSAVAVITSIILVVVANVLMCYKAAAKVGIGFFISSGVELFLVEFLLATGRKLVLLCVDRP